MKTITKRPGRPTKQFCETKLNNILEDRGLTRTNLSDLILKKYPDEPISLDGISRICSGDRKYYSTKTLFKISSALNVTPNEILDFETFSIQ